MREGRFRQLQQLIKNAKQFSLVRGQEGHFTLINDCPETGTASERYTNIKELEQRISGLFRSL